MGFLVKALLVLFLAAIGGVAYVVKLAFLYIGSDILSFCWRLFRQGMLASNPATIDASGHLSFTCFVSAGSLKFGRLSFHPHIAISNFALVEPKSAGEEVLFSAKLSVVESPLTGLLSGRSIATS